MARVSQFRKMRPKVPRRFGKVRAKAKGRRRPQLRAVGIPRNSLSAFPTKKIVRHRYIDSITMPAASGAGLPSQYVMWANNLYDPDLTGVGHQPLYHDEMAAKYQCYTVLVSSIKVTFNQSDTNQSHHAIIAGRDTTLPTNPTTFMEQYGYIAPRNLSQANGPVTLRKSWNAAKAYGTTMKGVIADDGNRIAVGASPAGAFNKWYYVIYRAPLFTGTTVAAQIVGVAIDYTVVWFNPQDATQS